MLSWIFIVLAHWNNSLLIHPTRIHYPDSEPTSLCSFSLMLGDATNTNFIVFSLIRLGLDAIIYNTGGEHANHYTTNYQCSLSNNEKYFNIYIYINIYIICTFHLLSLVWLVKRLACDFKNGNFIRHNQGFG
jgi:hypothetical protein